MKFCFTNVYFVLFYLTLLVCSQSDDPLFFNPGPEPDQNGDMMVGDLMTTDMAMCGSFKSGACADMWEPVCDVYEVMTYPNCCEASKENVTEVKKGECCEGCPVFGASEEPFGIPGLSVDEKRDLLKDRNSRKLLDTEVDQAVTDLFMEAGIDPGRTQPTQPTIIFEAIQGLDDRILVEITEQFPFASVGRLESGCTAFLVGPRHVLTAGHCIYNLGEWQTDLKFSPGQNNNTKPFGEINWYAARVAREWFEDQSVVDYDYGMIYLTETIGNQTGILDYEVKCGRSILPLNLLGYPIDKKPASTMWLSKCGEVVFNCTMTTFLHDCDTFAGMSGGPMFLYELGQGNRFKFTVTGIHFGNSVGTLNEGITITEKMAADIQDWITNDSSEKLP